MHLGTGFAVGVVYSPGATALIRPLALEHPYAAGVALKRKKKKCSWCAHCYSLFSRRMAVSIKIRIIEYFFNTAIPIVGI